MTTQSAPSYDQWNRALADWYFPADGAGRTAYLAVDDDDLQGVAREHGFSCSDASKALSEAVRSRLGPSQDRFIPLRRTLTSWRDQTDVPPYIGLLAMFVLAASRMEADSERGIAANDYYSRLNPLLNREQFAGMPPGFDALARLWKDLESWLDDELTGSRGTSAIQTHPVLVHIGYPISQSALRASDRHRLPDFFRSAGLEPASEISDSRLWVLLKAWASRPSCGLSSRGRRAITESDEGLRTDAIIAIAQRELRDWDGILRDVEGRRRAECLLVLALRRAHIQSVRVFAPRAPDFPVRAHWSDARGGIINLHEVAPGWYSEIGNSDLKGLLRDGLTLTYERYALSLSPADLTVFSKTFVPESGWLSQRRAAFLHEHIVLARVHLRAELENLLEQHAANGWKRFAAAPPLPPDWVGYSDVVLRSAPSGPVADGLEPLVPRLNTATQVEGGLRLGNALYLTGGEPDLYVTVAADEIAVVEIDGRSESFREGTVKLALKNTDLGPGSHVIRAGGRTIRLNSERTLGQVEPDSAGELAQIIEKHRRYQPRSLFATDGARGPVSSGAVKICGAYVEGSARDLPMPRLPPVVLPRGFARYEILGSLPGHIGVFESPPKPAWLEGLHASAQYFEAYVGFDAQIAILTGRSGKTIRSLRNPPEPPANGSADATAGLPPSSDLEGSLAAVAPPPGTAEQAKWSIAVLDAAASEPLVREELCAVWRAYVAAATGERTDR